MAYSYGMKHVLKVMKEPRPRLRSSIPLLSAASAARQPVRLCGEQTWRCRFDRNSGIEYGQFGISINAIAPGAIMTPMVEGFL